MAKNLIVYRMKVYPTKKEQEIYDEKVSYQNLDDLLVNSGIPLILKPTLENAIYFGSDKDLVDFGNDLKTEKIVFYIK